MDSTRQFPASFVGPWKKLLQSHQAEQTRDFPNHYVDDPECLITTSVPQSLYVGTGYSIFQRGILPAIRSAKHSVHFVTCYWAASPTLEAIREALVQLAEARGIGSAPKLTVTIGFSSMGLLQKLLHTSSTKGYAYAPSQWSRLGLPDPQVMSDGGIDLTVKSLFFTPFSVMHPKYIIIDEDRVFIPSCNVSWEKWFEGCIELEGEAVSTLMAFHLRVWGAGSKQDRVKPLQNGAPFDAQRGQDQTMALRPESSILPDEASATRSARLGGNSVPTILLPSPHHRNPRFSLFPFLSQSDPPMTPLNAALLTLFTNAKRNISILTPNVTSWPVINALLDALDRGVHVQIRTSKNMMLIEQLVTAGTTTSRCLGQMVKKYKQLANNQHWPDLEAQPVGPGNLEILYYRPVQQRRERQDEPDVTHFKMTLVDDEYLVLGSGNMDRASWWTSQELGVLFYVPGMDYRNVWDSALQQRTEVFFCSTTVDRNTATLVY